MQDNAGKYVLVVDGSIPTGAGGAYCTAGGRSAVDILREAAKGGGGHRLGGNLRGLRRHSPGRPQSHHGLGRARHRRRQARRQCLRLSADSGGDYRHAAAIHHHGQGARPRRARGGRKSFFGNTIHDRCYRRPFYDQGKFAKSFDDEGARNGWCLFELGCKGPTPRTTPARPSNGTAARVSHSSRATPAWAAPNLGSGDKGSFYAPLSAPACGQIGRVLPASGLGNRRHRRRCRGRDRRGGLPVSAGCICIASSNPPTTNRESETHGSFRFRSRPCAQSGARGFLAWVWPGASSASRCCAFAAI